MTIPRKERGPVCLIAELQKGASAAICPPPFAPCAGRSPQSRRWNLPRQAIFALFYNSSVRCAKEYFIFCHYCAHASPTWIGLRRIASGGARMLFEEARRFGVYQIVCPGMIFSAEFHHHFQSEER